MPVLGGSQNRAGVEVEEAIFEQCLERYKKTALNALKEVEDAVAKRVAAAVHKAAVMTAVETADRELSLEVTRQYIGISGMEDVLERQRSVLVLREQHAIASSAESISVIALFKAIGGAVTPEAPNKPEDNLS
jgi:outer membrane protein TolC